MKSALAVVAAVVAAAATAYGVLSLVDAPEHPRTDAPLATRRFVSESGGYSFRYPPGWTVERSDTRAVVTDPSADVIVAFGIAPEGTLTVSSRRFVTSLARQYRGTDLTAADRRRIGGEPALVVAGSARNDNGTRIRFLAITVAAPARNYAIVVFTGRGSDPLEVLPPVQEIVSSFRAHPPPA